MYSRSLRHEGALEKIREVLAKLVPGGWHLQVAQAIQTTDSLPEPDVAIVADALDSDTSRAPRGEEIAFAALREPGEGFAARTLLLPLEGGDRCDVHRCVGPEPAMPFNGGEYTVHSGPCCPSTALDDERSRSRP